jgi:hypothetical protein
MGFLFLYSKKVRKNMCWKQFIRVFGKISCCLGLSCFKQNYFISKQYNIIYKYYYRPRAMWSRAAGWTRLLYTNQQCQSSEGSVSELPSRLQQRQHFICWAVEHDGTKVLWQCCTVRSYISAGFMHGWWLHSTVSRSQVSCWSAQHRHDSPCK